MAKKQDKSEKDWESLAKAAEKAEEEMTAEEAVAYADETAETSDAPAGVLEHPSYRALEDKLTATEAEVHKQWDKAMRATSELENARKRFERDVENAHKYSTEKLINELLPVIDSLEQALQSGEKTQDIKALHDGVKLTLKMMLDNLVKFNLSQINPLNEPFDPHSHEAITMQDDPSAAPNTVLAVIQKGYRLHDRVIRPAMVVVSKGGAKKIDTEA